MKAKVREVGIEKTRFEKLGVWSMVAIFDSIDRRSRSESKYIRCEVGRMIKTHKSTSRSKDRTGKKFVVQWGYSNVKIWFDSNNRWRWRVDDDDG
jgi:hypothetical protein